MIMPQSPFSDIPQTPGATSPANSPPPVAFQPPPQSVTQSLPSSPKHSTSSLGSVSRGRTNTGFASGSTSYNLSTQKPAPQTRPSFPPQQRSSLSSTIVPQTQSPIVPAAPMVPSSGPNYNISLSQAAPMQPLQPSFSALPPMQPSFTTQTMAPSNPPTFSSPPLMAPMMAPAMSSVLTPSRPPQPAWPANGGSKALSKDDWGDFDPLA